MTEIEERLPVGCRNGSSKGMPAKRILYYNSAGSRKVRCIDEEKKNQLLEIHQTEPDIFHLRSDFDVNRSCR